LQRYPVVSAYVFGSVCTDSFHEGSDIDLIISLDETLDPVEYGEIYWELNDILPQILGRETDLLTEKMLRNPYFVKVVNQTKTLIYERPSAKISA
jgi:predicted nucleotidyltransferase